MLGIVLCCVATVIIVLIATIATVSTNEPSWEVAILAREHCVWHISIVIRIRVIRIGTGIWSVVVVRKIANE